MDLFLFENVFFYPTATLRTAPPPCDFALIDDIYWIRFSSAELCRFGELIRTILPSQ